MVKHTPKKNIEYTLVIPETGRIITIRFLNMSEKKRLIFLNTENNNTLDFHPSRFSFLYEKCKIKETVLKEPEEPKIKVVPKHMLIEEPEPTDEEFNSLIKGWVKELQSLSPGNVKTVKSVIGRSPASLIDDLKRILSAKKNEPIDVKIMNEYFRARACIGG